MEFTATQEIILNLKAVKEAQNLSIPKIKDIVDSTGAGLSLTTIRRVFADNSETEDSFSYENTLRPIAQALLVNSPNDDDIVRANVVVFVAILRHKNESIDSLKKQIEMLRNEHDTRCKECEGRMDFLMHQIDLKDKRMERKDAIIDRLLPYALQRNENI